MVPSSEELDHWTEMSDEKMAFDRSLLLDGLQK